ncbi:MAG: VOC family protein [Pseudomonadota bacterium]|jgi:catechol 2,3-dioxygenase-like lactoylglutathione lyase family enzyme|uniref:VOC family protein n=1 Tax=Silanimonas sp. TaxID=1929290 RepID=UPI0022BF2980|nr:hypothetical protein [Silanimonas sp.]MCZ8116191.1 hypothetical protein [Silanimonas sp.]
MIPDTYPKRITLLVADAARSRRFYEHGLGLPVWYDDRVPVEGDRLPIRGVTGGTDTHLVIVQGKDAEVGMIGLLQVLGRPPAHREVPRQLEVGDVVLVMTTRDARALAGLIQVYGGTLHKPPYEWQVPAQGTGRPKTIRTVACFDPDGYFIEANEYVAG